MLVTMCRSSEGMRSSAAFWNVWWCDESLTCPVPICIRSPLSPTPLSEAPTFCFCTASFIHEKQTSLGISNVFPSLGFFIVDNKTLTPHKKNLVLYQILSFVSISPLHLSYHCSLFSNTWIILAFSPSGSASCVKLRLTLREPFSPSMRKRALLHAVPLPHRPLQTSFTGTCSPAQAIF